MSVVLVTGANSGIGQQTALTFARAGHPVVAGSRSISRAEGLVGLAEQESLSLRVVQLDVMSDASVSAAVSAAEAMFGPVDVLVNNAGIVEPGPVELVTPTAVRRIFETNFFGPLRLIHAVLPSMRARRSGAIVLVGSLAGRVPAPGNGAYAAAKQAAAVLSDALALEVEEFGIRVCCVEIGPYRTGVVSRTYASCSGTSEYEGLLARIRSRTLRRLNESSDPAEVATAIVELADARQLPLRLPVGRHACAELRGDDLIERGREQLRAELGLSAPSYGDSIG